MQTYHFFVEHFLYICNRIAFLMMKMKKVLIYLIVVLALTACYSDRPTHSDWPSVNRKLQELDDSIAVMSAAVPQMITNGMVHAQDSIEWYAYYVRWANYFFLSTTPDSLLPYTQATVSFAHRARTHVASGDQQRLNTVEGMAYEAEAAYRQHFRSLSDTVITLRKQAYNLLMKSDMAIMLPMVCGNMADVYALQNRLPEASLWYRRALFLADSTSVNPSVKATLYMGLGRIYQNLSDFENARNCYEKVGERLHSMPLNMQAYYLNNYGNFFYYQKDYAKALSMFQQLEQLLKRIGAGDTFDMYLCLLNMGDVLLNLGRTDEALNCIDRVEPFFRQNQVADAVDYCQTVRIGAAVKKGELKRAEQLLAVPQLNPHTEQGLSDIRNRYTFDYYMKTGQTARALDMKLAEEKRNDSIGKNREHMRATEIIMRMSEDTLRLNHQLEIAQQRENTQKSYFWIMILTALVIILILVLAYRWMYARRQRTQNEMDMLRLRLANVQQRISPHFVFNVLNHRIGHAQEDEEKELMKLVKLIRANLDVSSRTIVTLQEEMDFVSYYISLEQELTEHFVYTIDVAPGLDLSALHIPSMFVQILAENAIKHGLKGRDGEKRLTIQIAMEKNDTLVIVVSDNGRGFDIRAVKDTTTGTGLYIIRQTMEVLNKYSRHGQMDIDLENLKDGTSTTTTGCQATLRIPQHFNNLT